VDLGDRLFCGAARASRRDTVSVSERVRYRRLPGRRRGMLHGASVWMGPDHLLLVRSTRFREEYRRFHLRDIQAISVAAAPRFHISTRSIGIAVLWLIVFAVGTSRGPTWGRFATLAVAAVLVGAWIYISAACSCVCRIYTAVSRDDLPSIYRTWTARRFMSRVQARIVEAQGGIGEDWAETLEARRIGPPELAPEMPATGVAASLPGTRSRRDRELSVIYVALMFVDAAITYVAGVPSAGHPRSTLVSWVGYGTLGLEIGTAVALLIQYGRGKLKAGMQRLIIASVLVTGATWYASPIIAAISAGVVAGRQGKVVTSPGALPVGGPVQGGLHVFDIGAHLLWGLAGAAIILTEPRKRPGVIAE
jgi:hypothetical protein